jgi:uncharacterized protein YbjT (DUF2867 family)
MTSFYEKAAASRPVFVTGGTGYIGRPLIEALLVKGYTVHALVRTGSRGKLPPGALPVIGEALVAASFDSAIPRSYISWARRTRTR